MTHQALPNMTRYAVVVEDNDQPIPYVHADTVEPLLPLLVENRKRGRTAYLAVEAPICPEGDHVAYGYYQLTDDGDLDENVWGCICAAEAYANRYL